MERNGISAICSQRTERGGSRVCRSKEGEGEGIELRRDGMVPVGGVGEGTGEDRGAHRV